VKVTGVRAFPVVTPPPNRGGVNWLFAAVDTDAGITGYGEVMLLANPFSLPVAASLVTELGSRYLVGHDPYDAELLWEKVYARAGYSHYPEQTKLGVLSAFDVACWDIVGKDVGQPIYNLMGGSLRDRVRTYTYIYDEENVTGTAARTNQALWQRPVDAARRARYYADLGFTGLKLDPFPIQLDFADAYGQVFPVQFPLETLDTAEAVISAVREAVGSRCDILVGTHGQMTAASAIRIAKRLERFDPLWFEEPVPPEMPGEMAKVARATSIPVTTGERLTTKYDFARLIEAEAAAIFNFDIGQVGGIWEARKIAAMAEAHYLQVSPHVYNGPINAAASVQLAVCCPNFLIMEAIERFDGFHAELIDPVITWEDGNVVPSGLPGLGHSLREDVAARYAPGRAGT
jgi:galactonate dehydratase